LRHLYAKPASLAWALVGLMLAGSAQAGSSLRSEAQVFYNGTLGYNWATRYWDQAGDSRDIGCRSTYQSFSHYGEYGWSYYHTLFGAVGLARSACADNQESGLSDLKLGVRGRVNRYLNDRAWELELTVPTHEGAIGASISCGAYQLAANLERQHDEVTPWLDLSYGTSLRLAQAPLVHSLRGKVGASGPIVPRWKWRLGVEHAFPLTDRDNPDPTTTVPDCGTNSQLLRAGTEIKFQYSRELGFGCGAGLTFWGEDTSANRGVYCGLSRLWE
jgi:hypothetical protein